MTQSTLLDYFIQTDIGFVSRFGSSLDSSLRGDRIFNVSDNNTAISLDRSSYSFCHWVRFVILSSSPGCAKEASQSIQTSYSAADLGSFGRFWPTVHEVSGLGDVEEAGLLDRCLHDTCTISIQKNIFPQIFLILTLGLIRIFFVGRSPRWNTASANILACYACRLKFLGFPFSVLCGDWAPRLVCSPRPHHHK